MYSLEEVRVLNILVIKQAHSFHTKVEVYNQKELCHVLCIEKLHFSFNLDCVHAKFGCKHFTCFILIFMNSYTLTHALINH